MASQEVTHQVCHHVRQRTVQQEGKHHPLEQACASHKAAMGNEALLSWWSMTLWRHYSCEGHCQYHLTITFRQEILIHIESWLMASPVLRLLGWSIIHGHWSVILLSYRVGFISKIRSFDDCTSSCKQTDIVWKCLKLTGQSQRPANQITWIRRMWKKIESKTHLSNSFIPVATNRVRASELKFCPEILV